MDAIFFLMGVIVMIELSDDNPLTVERIKKWQSDTNMYPLVNNRLDYRLLDADVCIIWLTKELKEARERNANLKDSNQRLEMELAESHKRIDMLVSDNE